MWRDLAACADIPVEAFFIDSGEVYPPEVRDACAHCPVWKPCLLDALKDRDTVNHGYRAGTVPRIRQRMIRDPWFVNDYIAVRERRAS